jgi:hypothetical protein
MPPSEAVLLPRDTATIEPITRTFQRAEKVQSWTSFSRLNSDSVASTVVELSSFFHQALPRGVTDIVHSYLAPANMGPGTALKVRAPNGSIHEAIVLYTYSSPSDSLLFVNYPECKDPSTREWIDVADPSGRTVDGLLLTRRSKLVSITGSLHRRFHRQLEHSCRRQAEFLLLAWEIDESLPLLCQDTRLLTEICNIRCSFATSLSLLMMLSTETVTRTSIWGVSACPLCSEFMHPERFIEHALFDCTALSDERNEIEKQVSSCSDSTSQDSSRIEVTNYMLADVWNSPAARFQPPSVLDQHRRSMLSFSKLVFKRLKSSS